MKVTCLKKMGKCLCIALMSMLIACSALQSTKMNMTNVYAKSKQKKKHTNKRKSQKGKKRTSKTKCSKSHKSKKKNTYSTSSIGTLLVNTKTAHKTNQILLVYGPYSHKGKVKYYHCGLWNKENQRFVQSISSDDCRCGSNGLRLNRHTGDKTTPIGSFLLTDAFGFGINPGTDMNYHQINNQSYWGGDGYSWGGYRNRYYEGNHPGNGGEHMRDYYQYEYGMNIGYNYSPVIYNKGACIFLHCNGKGNTAGCVSVPKDVMKQYMSLIHRGAYIMIVPSASMIKNY